MNLTQEWSTAFCSCLICVGALRYFTFSNSCTLITRPFSYTIFLPSVCACIFRINIFACVGIISVSGRGREVRSMLHNMKQLQVRRSIVPSPSDRQLFPLPRCLAAKYGRVAPLHENDTCLLFI